MLTKKRQRELVETCLSLTSLFSRPESKVLITDVGCYDLGFLNVA